MKLECKTILQISLIVLVALLLVPVSSSFAQTPPQLIILTPNNQVITNTDQFVISGASTSTGGGNAITSVTCKIDDGPALNVVDQNTLMRNGGGILSLPPFRNWFFDSPHLANGKHVMTVTATDSHGASTVASISVTINYAPPAPIKTSITITSPINGTTITNVGNVALTGTTKGQWSSMTWSVDASTMKNKVTTTFPNWSFTTTAMTRGPHTIYVSITGPTGTATAKVNVVSMFGGTTPPQIAILSPSNGIKITTPTLTVSGTVGNAMVSGMTWKIDNGASTTMMGIGKSTIPGSIPWSFTTGMLSAGSHVIYVTATGPSGTNTVQVSITK